MLEQTRELRSMVPATSESSVERPTVAEALAARVRTYARPAAVDADALVAAARRIDASPGDASARAELDRAADALVVALRAENRRVSLELGERWENLIYVALTVLALAAGLLAVTAISHRLRLRAEALERAMRARTAALQDAATQWAGGDRSRPIPPDPDATDDFGGVLEQLRDALSSHVTELERRHRDIELLARPVLAAIAEGLAAIHARGIVHRDLKLANVVVGQTANGDELTKILDFGIARDTSDEQVAGAALPAEVEAALADPHALRTPPSAAQTPDPTRVVPLGVRGTPAPGVVLGPNDPLTMAGMLVGTPRYMAPEARVGILLTPAADVFSFGVLAVKLLCGEFPWSVPLAPALRRGEEAPPPSIDATLPEDLRQILARCLSIDPLDRPTAGELVKACGGERSRTQTGA